MLTPDIILPVQDMRHLNWSRIRQSSGTAGSFLKAWEKTPGGKVYYKLSCFDTADGIIGHENINEIIVDRLLRILGIDHLHYQLIHSLVRIGDRDYDTWITASEDFKEPGDSKLALDDYYDLEKLPGESPLAFCTRMGWSQTIYEMLIIDFLICNRDRHGANIEVLYNRRRNLTRLAPLFDQGLSLLYSCHTKADILSFDVMKDRPVQCFVGSHSASKNLSLIPGSDHPALRRLESRDKTILFNNLYNILPEYHLDKIWEMIWGRWQIYEDLCNH